MAGFASYLALLPDPPRVVSGQFPPEHCIAEPHGIYEIHALEII